MKTILIVEDNELNIDLLSQLLEDEYKLVVAKDGEQGIAMAEQCNPDLVLMDISLPVMDGYAATRAIRSMDPSLPVIGFSAHAMHGDADKALSGGFTDYITKPINEDILFAKLKQYLG